MSKRFGQSRRLATTCLALGVALFASIALVTALDAITIDSDSGSVDSVQTLSYGLAFALIVFGCVVLERLGHVIGGHRALQLLGDASYSIYLLHYPMISFMLKALFAIGLQRFGTPGALIAFVGMLPVVLSVSVAFHLLVERGLTELLTRRRNNTRLTSTD